MVRLHREMESIGEWIVLVLPLLAIKSLILLLLKEKHKSKGLYLPSPRLSLTILPKKIQIMQIKVRKLTGMKSRKLA